MLNALLTQGWLLVSNFLFSDAAEQFLQFLVVFTIGNALIKVVDNIQDADKHLQNWQLEMGLSKLTDKMTEHRQQSRSPHRTPSKSGLMSPPSGVPTPHSIKRKSSTTTFEQALVQVRQWKERLYRDGLLRLQPEEVRGWLKACGVPAEDLEKFRQVWGKLHQDPRVPHRFADQSRCAFTLDPDDTHDVRADPEFVQQANVAWKLAADDLAGDLVGVSGEYASLDMAVGNGQTWCEIPVVRALNLLYAKLIDSRAESGCYSPPDCEQSNTFLMNMFAARCFRDADNSGDPSVEGVHTDGNAMSVIMFMGRDNVLPGTGTNRVFKSNMSLGKYDEAEFQRPGGLRDQHLIAESVFDTPFETVILLDRVVKHEGRPFQQAQIHRQAHRDTYLTFLRSPKLDGTDQVNFPSWQQPGGKS